MQKSGNLNDRHGRPESRLNFQQKTVFSLIAFSLGAALTLWWLRGVVGAFGKQIFWRFTFEQDLPIAWAMVMATLLAVPLVFGPLRRFNGPKSEAAAEWIDAKIWLIAAAMLPIYAALALFATHNHAFTSDESTVLMQSRIFATGHGSADVPAYLLDWIVPREYQGHFFHVSHHRGELISSYWPGFALLLTPFSFFGVPWLCNPILTCVSIWALHRATLALFGSKTTAAWAVIFFISSPVIALNAATFYSMPAHLLANLLFCWLLSLGTKRTAFAAGMVGSFALILHNPAPHMLFALPWIVWVLGCRRAILPALLEGYLVFVPLGLWWSSNLGTFDITRDILAAQATSKALSSGPFLEVLARLQATFIFPSLAIWLLRLAGVIKVAAWATPGLLVFAYLGAKSSSRSGFSRLLVTSFVFTFVAFLFVRFAQGGGWGFRYVHQVWFVLAMLVGAFLASETTSPPIKRLAALLAVLSFALFLPLRAAQVESFTRGYLAQVPDAPKAGASVRFIRVQTGFQTAALVQNDPFLRGSHWNVVDKGAIANKLLAKRLLNRPRRVSSGNWGEIWVGDALKTPVGQ